MNTALDRARAVAMLYRRNLQRLNPEIVDQIDAAAVSAGETWVVDITTGERSCTVTQAAALLGLGVRRVQQLAHDGVIRHAGSTRGGGYILLLDDVEAYQRRARCEP